MNLIATENSFCFVLNIIIHMLDTRFQGCLSDFKFVAYLLLAWAVVKISNFMPCIQKKIFKSKTSDTVNSEFFFLKLSMPGCFVTPVF
jgi:hypothetical protein